MHSMLKSFVFNGMLVKDGLRALSAEGIPLDSVSENSVVSRVEQLNYPLRILEAAARMSSVFVVFFSMENSVRELITQRLSEKYGLNWWEEKIPQKIREKVNSLKDSEELHRYHTPRSSELIGYTTFGHLAQIIIARWEDFEDLFPDQAWINSRFSDMERSRNIIMHTGILEEVEIERAEVIARDWIRQVG